MQVWTSGDVKAERDGGVKFVGINLVTNAAGRRIALPRNGEIRAHDAMGREVAKYDIADGAEMEVEDGQTITRGTMLREWDPHDVTIFSEVGDRVRREDIVEDETMRIEIDPSGHARRTIVEHGGTSTRRLSSRTARGTSSPTTTSPRGRASRWPRGR